jgi:hypothetical protein
VDEVPLLAKLFQRVPRDNLKVKGAKEVLAKIRWPSTLKFIPNAAGELE